MSYLCIRKALKQQFPQTLIRGHNEMPESTPKSCSCFKPPKNSVSSTLPPSSNPPDPCPASEHRTATPVPCSLLSFTVLLSERLRFLIHYFHPLACFISEITSECGLHLPSKKSLWADSKHSSNNFSSTHSTSEDEIYFFTL